MEISNDVPLYLIIEATLIRLDELMDEIMKNVTIYIHFSQLRTQLKAYNMSSYVRMFVIFHIMFRMVQSPRQNR